ncbi:X-ray radiation resistance-associated protein 1 isoform X2 [Scophthalmus maximus]|uniref:X-ray radiation resistance-associated protein 1 n=1 Tax=Scophthalmus maximus TaxID=52904 RepID=A0A8D3API3_SCOMX|nr:X-ray radiation resistance-associated protein 1 isoform X2 [Scophthalmus maximus]
MTAASYKFDDGQRNPTKCSPARTLLRRRNDGGGHGLVAHRRAEEQRYSEGTRDNGRVARTSHGCIDGAFLLQLHCVDKPSELRSIDISEHKLNSVKPEDLSVFENVAHIDASVNLLSLGSFSSFVSLRELNLAVNHICNMTFEASDFPHLEVLDLSYNSLSADDVVSISWLPRLKVLHLTGNHLHRLPLNLCSSNRHQTQPSAKGGDSQFRALEVLMLDDNRLTSGVFGSLRNLERLKYLNLQGNRISEIPYLQPTASSKAARASAEQQAEQEGAARTEPDPDDDGRFRGISQAGNLEECCRGSRSPLPELQLLDLSDNRIAEEEALMAAALFPMLREIDIHSNPLTTQRSGDPPLLTHYLRERLGITIKRRKTQEAGKPPLKVSTDPKWKVEQRIPKVSKKSVLMDEETELTVKKTTECEGKNRRDDPSPGNTEPFFFTQAADVSEYEFDLGAGEREAAEGEDGTVPEKCDYCKMLMDAKPNPGVAEPFGIQTAVRMLEHTLKTLHVYRDSNPNYDSIQMPYREQEKRIKELPPLKRTEQPAERVHQMLKEIKQSTAMREVALSGAIHSAGVDKREHQEVLSLLGDMKTKYKMLHRRAIEQAAGVGSDRNTDIN